MGGICFSDRLEVRLEIGNQPCYRLELPLKRVGKTENEICSNDPALELRVGMPIYALLRDALGLVSCLENLLIRLETALSPMETTFQRRKPTKPGWK